MRTSVGVMWHRTLARAASAYHDTHSKKMRYGQLLAWRDATVAVLATVAVGTLSRHMWPTNDTIRAIAYPGEYFPFMLAAVGVVVYSLSLIIRGTDRHLQSSPRGALTYMLGVVLFVVGVFLSMRAGIIPQHSLWASVPHIWIPLLLGSGGVTGLRVLLWLYRR